MNLSRRRSRGPLATSRALILFGIISVATHASANVVSVDAQNFNSITSGLDFVTVQSSETLKPGVANLGLFLNFAVNTLPYMEKTPGNRLNFNDSLLGLDLNAGLGLTRGWDVGVSFPHILSQSVEDQNARGEFASTGSTEIRMNSKIRLAGDDSGGFAVVGSMGFNRIENNSFAGRDPGPTTNLELVADTTFGRAAYGVNVGYRIRQPGTRIPSSVVEPLKDQWIASGAISYHVPDWDTKFIGEVFGSFPSASSSLNADRALSSLEILAGAKRDLSESLAMHAGVSTGLGLGVASPDWRVYTGLNYTFGPLWGPSIQENQDQYLTRIEPPPAPPEDPPVARPLVERFRTQNILFEFDSDRMIGNYAAALTELASHLRSGFRELQIEGHTDSIGAAAYNEKLSLKRASAIKRYLIEKENLEGRKITSLGYGESRPIADNGNYQGRQLNRRVEFLIRR